MRWGGCHDPVGGAGTLVTVFATAGAALATAVVLLAMLAVLAAYLRRPPWRDYRPSAARFLQDVGGEVPRAVRFDPRRLLARWRLWLRLAVLVMVLAAMTDLSAGPAATDDRRIGLLVVVDTSFSMTARSGAGTRLDEAVTLLSRLAGSLRAVAEELPVCSRVLLVDNQVRDGGPLGATLPAPRPRGGSAAGLSAAVRHVPQDCAPSQVVVITDLPRPGVTLGGGEGPPPVWLTVGQPAANAGIVRVQLAASVDGRPGVEVTVAGNPVPSSLDVMDPRGRRLRADRADPEDDGRFTRFVFRPEVSGMHRVGLTNGGAYIGDDVVAVDVVEAQAVTVAWDSRAPWPARPGWRRIDDPEAQADLAVVPAANGVITDRAARTLLTFPWPSQSGLERGDPATVGLFLEDHPILAGVSLDVFERVAPDPFSSLPDGFSPVLTDPEGRPWIAISRVPSAVLLPEWREADDRDAANLIDTLFFNSLRWLIEDTRPSLGIDWLTPDGRQIPGGAGEWTAGRASELPEVPAPQAASGIASPRPLWPWLVLFAASLTVVDRLAGLWRTAR